MANQITINDFVAVVPWRHIEEVMVNTLGKRAGKKKYREFERFMIGQTCLAEGVYKCDLDRFLRGLPVID